MKQLVADLVREREQQQGHVHRFEQRLSIAGNAFTKMDPPRLCLVFNCIAVPVNAVPCAELILRQCILPRCKLSELDATYCGQFIRLMHRIGAPNFPTLNIVWTLFNNLSPVLTSLTEAEVSNIGIVACDMLAMVNAWHSDKSSVEKMVGVDSLVC